MDEKIRSVEAKLSGMYCHSSERVPGDYTERQSLNTGCSSIDFGHESPEIPAEHPAHS
jgi:hypothetical protein